MSLPAPRPPSPTWITAMTLTLLASALIPPQPVVRMTAPQAPTAGAGASHWPSEQMATHPACPGSCRLHLSWGDSKQHISLSKGANWITYRVLSPHVHTHNLVLAPECPLPSFSPLPRSHCLSLTSCVFCLYAEPSPPGSLMSPSLVSSDAS